MSDRIPWGEAREAWSVYQAARSPPPHSDQGGCKAGTTTTAPHQSGTPNAAEEYGPSARVSPAAAPQAAAHPTASQTPTAASPADPTNAPAALATHTAARPTEAPWSTSTVFPTAATLGEVSPRTRYGEVSPRTRYGEFSPRTRYGEVSPRTRYGEVSPGTYDGRENDSESYEEVDTDATASTAYTDEDLPPRVRPGDDSSEEGPQPMTCSDGFIREARTTHGMTHDQAMSDLRARTVHHMNIARSEYAQDLARVETEQKNEEEKRRQAEENHQAITRPVRAPAGRGVHIIKRGVMCVPCRPRTPSSLRPGWMSGGDSGADEKAADIHTARFARLWHTFSDRAAGGSTPCGGAESLNSRPYG